MWIKTGLHEAVWLVSWWINCFSGCSHQTDSPEGKQKRKALFSHSLFSLGERPPVMESLVSNNASIYNCNTDFHDVSHRARSLFSHRSLITEEMQSEMIQVYTSGWITDSTDFHIPIMLGCWCAPRLGTKLYTSTWRRSRFQCWSFYGHQKVSFILSLVSNTEVPFKLRFWNSSWPSHYGKKRTSKLSISVTER